MMRLWGSWHSRDDGADDHDDGDNVELTTVDLESGLSDDSLGRPSFGRPRAEERRRMVRADQLRRIEESVRLTSKWCPV
jgi:hypothetical protein